MSALSQQFQGKNLESDYLLKYVNLKFWHAPMFFIGGVPF